MYKIKKIDTSKDKIIQPLFSQNGGINLNTSTIISGRSGSGKSNVLANIMTESNMLKGQFDDIFIISPTAKSDDVQTFIQKKLKIPDENIFIDIHKGLDYVEEILKLNRKAIEKYGAHKCPLYCIIMDDVIGDREFMRKKFFTECFILSRHYNATVIVCTQSWTQLPRRVRLQANHILLFSGSQDEMVLLAETHCPARYSKKEFIGLINHATSEPYSFLFINLKKPQKNRYMKCFDTTLKLNRFPD